jgi:hypothetical protein
MGSSLERENSKQGEMTELHILFPRLVNFNNFHGGLRASQKSFGDAEKFLLKILPLSSDSIQAVEQLKRILLDQGKVNQAQKMSDRVLQLEEFCRRPR